MSDFGGDHVFDETVDAPGHREGLPREYQMRADRHYVDQISASASGQPVRMIPVAAIDGADVASSGTLRELIESIRRHGVIQPLLVRRQDSRYAVIAGRRRLLAAVTLRLPTVPCLVHDVTQAEAGALADADNLRALDGDSGAHRTAEEDAVLGGLAAKAWTELHEGEIKLERLPNGSRLTISIGRTS